MGQGTATFTSILVGQSDSRGPSPINPKWDKGTATAVATNH
jgi:hypothetical protein